MAYLSKEDKDSLIRDYNNNPNQTLSTLGKRFGITTAGASYHLTKNLKKDPVYKTQKKPIKIENFCMKKDCAYCNRIAGGNKDKLFSSIGVRYKKEEFITITLKSKI